VDPSACGGFSANAAGAKLKAFLEAVKELDAQAKGTMEIVVGGCKTMAKELGMSGVDSMEPKELCNKVWAEYNNGLKTAVKGKAAFKVEYKPAVCRINVEATADIAAKCEGKASADVGASCSGTCNGTCEGKCAGGAKAGGGGAAGGGECHGQCNGTCKGKCEGHADVKASGECKAKAEAHASANMECTKAELKVTLDAKLVVDKGKAEKMLNALKNGVPELLTVKAKIPQLQAAVETTVATAKELKNAGGQLASSFKDQAMCVTGQIAAAVSAAMNIQASVSVSVSVSAEASGSVGS